jgi:hypothetical protein
MGFGSGFSAPPGVSRATTKISRTISTNDSKSAYSFTTADIINGSYCRIIPNKSKIVDALVISNVNVFAAGCGMAIGETISIKMLLQNEGGQYTISPSFVQGVGLFGDSLPIIQETSAILDLTFFYVKNGFLAIIVNNQEIRI